MQVIYVLIDPRDNMEFYVGRTEDLYRRFLQHLSANGKSTAKNARVKELKELHLLPICQTLETIEDAALGAKREAYWIHHFRYLGRILLNDIVYSSYAQQKEEGELQEALGESERRRTFIRLDELSRISGYSQDTLRERIKGGVIRCHEKDQSKIYVSSLKGLKRYQTGRFKV